jgi:hypothetical protein
MTFLLKNSIFGQKIAPDGINAWNPAFDITPFDLIKGVITELGVIESDNNDSSKIIPISKFLLALEPTNKLSKNLLQRLHKAVAPLEAPNGYVRMDESKIGKYIFSNQKLLSLLDLQDVENTDENIDKHLSIAEVGDGNLNFVYIVQVKTTASYSNNNKSKGFIVKQALPYVRCVGESWPLTFERATFESAALIEERKLLNGRFVPQVYLFDEKKALIGFLFIIFYLFFLLFLCNLLATK